MKERAAPFAGLVLGALVSLGALGLSCRPHPVDGAGAGEGEADGAAPSAASASPTRVQLDRSLFDSGRIRLASVARGSSDDDRTFPGEVVADEGQRAEAGVLTPGRIASLDVGVGHVVKKGELLAWVDAPEVARAAADVLRTRARSALAAKKEARQHALDADRATSPNAVEEAVAEAAVARADLQAAEGLLHSLGGSPAAGSRVAVRSPIDGVVAKRFGVLGGAVTVDKAIFEIVKRGPGVVLARLPEGTTEPPAVGSSARVRPRGKTDDRGEGCKATVRGDLGAIDLETRTRGFRVDPVGACPWLVVGAFVRVDLGAPLPDGGTPSSPPSALVVPRDAIVDVKGATGVFLATETSGELVFRGVRVERGRGDNVVVSAGLVDGDRVVVVGAALVKSELLRAEITP